MPISYRDNRPSRIKDDYNCKYFDTVPGTSLFFLFLYLCHWRPSTRLSPLTVLGYGFELKIANLLVLILLVYLFCVKSETCLCSADEFTFRLSSKHERRSGVVTYIHRSL